MQPPYSKSDFACLLVAEVAEETQMNTVPQCQFGNIHED